MDKFAIMVLGSALLASCGSHDLAKGREDDCYTRPRGWPDDAARFDGEAVCRAHPRLQGRIVTAIEEYDRARAKRSSDDSSLSDERRLNPGDQVSVDVEGEPNLSRRFRVPPTGAYDYPLIGTIEAGGKTVRELKSDIREKLSKVLKKPIVTVTAWGQAPPWGSGQVSITMGGRSPQSGTLTLDAGSPLSAALGVTGLPGDRMWTEIMVIRSQSSEVVVCDWWLYLALADVRQDIVLLSEDIVILPKRYHRPQTCAAEWELVDRFLSGEMDRAGLLDALR